MSADPIGVFEVWRQQTIDLRARTAEERGRVAARLAELDAELAALDASLGIAPALPPHASLPEKVAHVLRSAARPLTAPEIVERLRKDTHEPLAADDVHSALWRMRTSRPVRVLVTGERPRRLYALPPASVSKVEG